MRVPLKLKFASVTLLTTAFFISAFSANASISINDVTLLEGGAATLTVSMDTMVERGIVRVDYSTQDGSANAGTDYEATSGRLTFRRESNQQ